MRFVIFILLLFGAIGWSGVTDILDHEHDKTFQVMSYSDFVSSPPRHGRVRVTGAGWQLQDAINVHGVLASDLFVPVKPQPDDYAPATILVHLNDYNQALDVENLWQQGEQQQKAEISRNPPLYTTLHEVEGRIIGISSKQRDALSGDPHVAEHYTVVDQGTPPKSMTGGLLKVAVSVILLLVTLLLVGRAVLRKGDDVGVAATSTQER